MSAMVTDATVFAEQVVHTASTPHDRAMAYRTIADLFDASLITHDVAQQLLDALDRRGRLLAAMTGQPAEMVN